MIQEYEFKGKNILEAQENAKNELGERIDAMEMEIVDAGKPGGLFGIGARPAVIKYKESVSDGAKKAVDFIRQLISNLGLEAEVSETPKENGVLIEVSGKDAGTLIGHHGDTLESIQYLANLTANNRRSEEDRDYTKISVDIEGYRAKREETLRALARRVSEKVLKYRRSVTLEPMSPGERRIIHSEVQNIEGVCTMSVGSDENRKVVVYLEGTTPVADRPRGRGGRGSGRSRGNGSSRKDTEKNAEKSSD